MWRSDARRRMASRSPGRKRIVIRSWAGPLLDGLGGKSGDCDSSQARMAITASVDSEICRWAATAANRRFSSDVGRAVIVGAADFKALSFTARNSELQQNADTSLSCHQSSNDPATLLGPKSLLYPIPQYGPKTLHNLLCCWWPEFRCFFSGTRPGVSATIGHGTHVNARLCRSPHKAVCVCSIDRPARTFRCRRRTMS